MVASLYSPQEESKSLWVLLEHSEGDFENVSLELLAKGRELSDTCGWSLIGLLLGTGVGDLPGAAIAHGADEVWVADHPLLEAFTIDAYASVVFQAIMDGKPSAILVGATPNSRDLAGRLAVRLRTGLNADCTGLRIDPARGVLVSEVSGFGGGVLALIEMQNTRPQMATIRPGVFQRMEPNNRRTGKIVELPVNLSEDLIKTRVLERVIGAEIDLTHAPVLVAGGRGIEGDFEMLDELAVLLEGEVGATRPPVDEGYIERERQIGQTGSVCNPKIAICCGISGAFHFLVGIEKADIVIAINNDPNAPIFEYADYCIIGDAHEIIPEIITAVRSTREVMHV